MKIPPFRCFEFCIQCIDVMLYLMRVHNRVHTIMNNDYAGRCVIRNNTEIYLCIRTCVNGVMDRLHGVHTKGPCTYDVRKISGIFYPPLVRISRNLSVLSVHKIGQFLKPPSPPPCGRHIYMVQKKNSIRICATQK